MGFFKVFSIFQSIFQNIQHSCFPDLDFVRQFLLKTPLGGFIEFDDLCAWPAFVPSSAWRTYMPSCLWFLLAFSFFNLPSRPSFFDVLYLSSFLYVPKVPSFLTCLTCFSLFSCLFICLYVYMPLFMGLHYIYALTLPLYAFIFSVFFTCLYCLTGLYF